MQSFPTLKRWLAGGLSAGVFLVVLVGLSLTGAGKVHTPVQAQPAAVAKPGDWTMFGGTLSRNMVNTTSKNLPVKWSVEEGEYENVKWAADLGSRAYGGPIIAAGKVFVGTNNQKPRDKKYVSEKGTPIDMGVLMCFDDPNGSFLWQNAFFKLPGGRVVDWPLEGICSTPTVEGNKVYYVSNRCEVVCSDVTSGAILWKLDMMKELGVFPHNLSAGAPLLIGDDIWLITANGVDEGHINVPAPKAPSFIKIAKKDGKVLWQDNTPTVKLTQVNKEGDQEAFFKRLVNRGDLIQHGQWSNPAYGVINGQPQVVFPGGNGWLYSYSPDGKLIWQFDCNPKDAEYELAGKGTRNDFIATPVIYNNRVYIGVGQDPEHETGVGHLWCIDMTKKGDVSPELADYSMWPPKTKANPNSALVWHYGGPIQAKDKGKLKRNYYFGRTMSTCAIVDDLVYVAELAGNLHCLDAKTGQPYWEHDTRGNIWSSPYWADGKIYLGTDSNDVFVFAHGKEKKLLAKNEMIGPVRATPVAANGVLYVISGNKLFALGKKS